MGRKAAVGVVAGRAVKVDPVAVPAVAGALAVWADRVRRADSAALPSALRSGEGSGWPKAGDSVPDWGCVGANRLARWIEMA